MFRKVTDFIARYKHEKESTTKILDALTDASLSQAVVNDHRNIGRIAWHVVTTYPEMAGQIGMKYEGIDHESPVPKTVEEIRNAYRLVSDATIDAVTKWEDGDLEKEDELYGEVWKRGLTLHILIVHEAHHRGQLTVLMRQAGLKVPGVYGPAMEEWANFGAQPPAV